MLGKRKGSALGSLQIVNMALFTIVIPTYNNRSQLENCLRSILKLDSDDYKVVICDNGSTDGTIEFLKDFVNQHPSFTFSEHPDKQNKGRAANRNQALPFTNSEYVLFLDSDATVSKEILIEHAKVLKANPNAVSIGKAVYSNANTNVWAAYLSKRGQGKYKHLENADYKYFNTQNVALPSLFFKELGGYDSKMFFYGGDDIEFGCRLRKTFHPSFIVNDKALVFAEMDKTFSKALEQFEEYGKYNLPYTIQKHPKDDDIFHFHLYLNNNLRSRFFRFILNDFFGSVLSLFLKISPSFLQVQIINYRVALAIKKGLLASK